MVEDVSKSHHINIDIKIPCAKKGEDQFIKIDNQYGHGKRFEFVNWRFDRSLLAAAVHLLFVCYLVEGLRLHSFLQASASEFASLRAGVVMKELAEAWPDNLVVTLQRSAGGEVHLEASRTSRLRSSRRRGPRLSSC